MLSLKVVGGAEEGEKHACSSLVLDKDCYGKRQGGGTNRNGSHWTGHQLLGALFMERRKRRDG